MPSIDTDQENDRILNEMFDALSHIYRRRILFNLVEREQMSSDFVSNQSGTGDPDILALKLYHIHLPKLDETEFVEWDEEDGTITRGTQFDVILPLLELLSENQELEK